VRLSGYAPDRALQDLDGCVIEDSPRTDIDRFILDRIDSIPQLEALVLLFQQLSASWSVERVARRLWIHAEDARSILQGLTRHQLVTQIGGDGEQCRYQANPDYDRLIQAVAESYRTDTVRISRMIHSKPSSIRYFMRPFVNCEEQ
jgi:hypothetical protein